MKLIIGRHPELAILVSYFKKIEAIAERLGIDVDELVSESFHRNTSMYMSFKKNLLTIAQNRTEILSTKTTRALHEANSKIVDLTIIINKQRAN